ncbi:MAG: SusC/RagA family TonB-linked outer membrane protein [Gemmatimonadales bacterium]
MVSLLRPFVAALGALLLLPAWAAAQQQQPTTITGRVLSDAGVPLAYADVRIPELAAGVLTRDNGTYAMVIPAARVSGQQVTIIARVLGYKQQSAQITLAPGTVTQDFTLIANPLQLGEVVVTGAGTVSAVEKLGSVRNSVDSTLITRSNEMNIVQALAGKAPNVEIESQSGEPGSSSFIRIRGAKTLTGTGQPLIVVDGVPIDNSTTSLYSLYSGFSGGVAGTVAPNRAADLNPNDVASVEILKGAAAAAVYGARAGQGVVLITTKSGSAGPTRVSFRSSVSVDRVTQSVPLQRIYGQGSVGAFPGGTTGEPPVCIAVGCGTLTGGSWGPRLQAATPTFDHFGELFRTGYISDNNMTIAGGNDRTLFYISGEHMYNRGMIVGPNNHYQRTSVRLKASQRLRDNLTIGGNVAYADTRGDYVQKGSNISGLLLGGLRTPPEFDSRTYIDTATGLHRSYRYPRPSAGSTTRSRGYDNPFFVLNAMANEGRAGRVFGNVNADYQPLNWLKLAGTLGVDYSTDERLEGRPQTSSDFPNGRVITADLKNLEISQGLVATASYTLNPNVSGTVTLGQGLGSRSLRQIVVVGNNLIAPLPFKLENTVDRDPPSDAETLIHTESYFGQATIDLWRQLYLTGGVRNDGSSTFGSTNRRNWFPKVSAAWDVTAALGDRRPAFLSFAKLRVAYGQTGIEPAAYQTINTFSTTQFQDGGWGPQIAPTQGGRGGLYSGIVKGQEALKPERTKEVEGGADLAFLRDRVDVHVTHYRETSSDVIFSFPLPASTGYQFQAQNAATITNRGWEVSLNLRPVATASMAWDVGLQWATNENRLKELRGANFVFLGAGFTDPNEAAEVGSRVGVIRGTDFVRCGRGIIDPVAGDIDAQCGGAPAGAVFLEASGYPLLDGELRVIGDPTPDWTASVRSSFRYKKWQISGLLDVKHGGQAWNGTKGALVFFGTHQTTEVRDVTRTFGVDYYTNYTFAGPGKGTPVLIDQANWYQGGIGSGFTGPASQYIEDAGFVKLREISVSYTLDQPWVQSSLGLSSIDLRVSGRNLKTWTDYTGIDPENSLNGAEYSGRGIDYFNHPQTRSFVFTVVLNR